MLAFLFICFLPLQVRSLVSPISTGVQYIDDYVLVDYHNVTVPFSNFSYQSTINGRNYSAYIAVLPSDISKQFSFELPTGSNVQSRIYP